MPREADEADQSWSLRLAQRAREDIEAAHTALSEQHGIEFADKSLPTSGRKA